MSSPIGKFFKGSDKQGNTYIAECTEIRQRKAIINFFNVGGKQVFDIVPSSIKEMHCNVFLVANIPTVGTHLINEIRGVYPTKERALENILDDGDIIMPIPFDTNDDGKIIINGCYPRLEEQGGR